jgi:hypothetical protein
MSCTKLHKMGQGTHVGPHQPASLQLKSLSAECEHKQAGRSRQTIRVVVGR